MVIGLLPHSTSQTLSPDATRSPLENAENDNVGRDFVVYGVVVVGAPPSLTSEETAGKWLGASAAGRLGGCHHRTVMLTEVSCPMYFSTVHL